MCEGRRADSHLLGKKLCHLWTQWGGQSGFVHVFYLLHYPWKLKNLCLNENCLQLHYIPLDGVFVTICAWRGNCLLTDLVDVWIEYIATSKAVLLCNHRSKHIWVELKMNWKLFQCVVNWAEEKVFCHSFQNTMGGTMNGNVPQRLQDDNYVDKSTCVPDSQAHQIQPLANESSATNCWEGWTSKENRHFLQMDP